MMTDPNRHQPNSPSHSGKEKQVTYQGGQTETICEEASASEQASPTLHLRLQPTKEEHKVKWSSDTVDNEFMGKKKSKCCCIYEKPKVFGESSTSEEEEEDEDGCTPHCRGHKKKCYRHKKPHRGHDNDHEHDGPGSFPPDGAVST